MSGMSVLGLVTFLAQNSQDAPEEGVGLGLRWSFLDEVIEGGSRGGATARRRG